MGHSMVDVHLNDLNSIKIALQEPKIMENTDTLLANAISFDEERRSKFFKEDTMRDMRIANNDFNFMNEIERAFATNDVLAQKFMLQQIL